MNILFVDDEQPILDMVREYFSSKDHDVFLAHNGKEAMEIIKSRRIECCFTDLNMPGMTGMELAHEIQNHDNTIPVIVMTGYPSLDAAISTLKSGVVDFLIKPIQLRQMEIVMQTVMNRSAMVQENVMLKKEIKGKAQLERIHRELKEKAHDLKMLNEIIETLESAGSVKEIFEKTISLALLISEFDAAYLFLTIGADQKPACALKRGNPKNMTGPGQVGKLQDAQEELISWLENTSFDSLPAALSGVKANTHEMGLVRSIAAAPISLSNRPFGVLVAVSFSHDNTLSAQVISRLAFAAEKAGMSVENLGLYENIYENLFSTLFAFVETLEARDAYTRMHSLRVTAIAELLAQELDLPEEAQAVIQVAGNLHDIGKIGISDSILLKPGKLNKDEFEEIKRHPDIGANIIGYMGLWDLEKEIVRNHHEKFDGSGYPNGLAGEEIPFLARILAVADVFDAVTTNRAYRRRLPEEVCLNIIREGSGNHFDPKVVDAFFSLYNKGVIQKRVEELQPNSTGRIPLFPAQKTKEGAP
ncbi:HD domain-containing phosphohydrolase [Desulfatibacillum aliphaticivorans]|uniref:HD domain-containing phosphohydrolase n=1 Tax=Desulfatibacillum aliphaticivorans TaxID=218208 RepID=UPI00040656E5|nr:HD domain-containing phosphohydrolase [Desulfatibacillum aliphaticivorans]